MDFPFGARSHSFLVRRLSAELETDHPHLSAILFGSYSSLSVVTPSKIPLQEFRFISEKSRYGQALALPSLPHDLQSNQSSESSFRKLLLLVCLPSVALAQFYARPLR